ncbi:hypothetical protein [Paractinoplanes rishiriensis]|uniref:Uncharacterized protein n=1 Tax=Paractinoplanes rishiriensis TaxID=1050105 RepID=A0A919KBJ7_9ACTN|nr:hypothetical protein [Actinoplanes rishiriensis]GIF02350.1 hypothetical protein Ari01nite_98140 [Actinoplanes rishiriensis]
MSDRHLNAQHAEVIDRNRAQRLSTMAEAQRLADARRAHAAVRQAERDDTDEM